MLLPVLLRFIVIDGRVALDMEDVVTTAGKVNGLKMTRYWSRYRKNGSLTLTDNYGYKSKR